MGELVKIGSVLSISRVGENRQHTHQVAHSASEPAREGDRSAADKIRVVN